MCSSSSVYLYYLVLAAAISSSTFEEVRCLAAYKIYRGTKKTTDTAYSTGWLNWPEDDFYSIIVKNDSQFRFAWKSYISSSEKPEFDGRQSKVTTTTAYMYVGVKLLDYDKSRKLRIECDRCCNLKLQIIGNKIGSCWRYSCSKKVTSMKSGKTG